MGFALPVLFALFAALSNALATVLQRRAALTVPQGRGLRFGLIRDLLRRPVWIAGILAVIAVEASGRPRRWPRARCPWCSRCSYWSCRSRC